MAIFDIEGNVYVKLPKAYVIEDSKYVALKNAFVVENGVYVKIWSANTKYKVNYVTDGLIVLFKSSYYRYLYSRNDDGSLVSRVSIQEYPSDVKYISKNGEYWCKDSLTSFALYKWDSASQKVVTIESGRDFYDEWSYPSMPVLSGNGEQAIMKVASYGSYAGGFHLKLYDVTDAGLVFKSEIGSGSMVAVGSSSTGVGHSESIVSYSDDFSLIAVAGRGYWTYGGTSHDAYHTYLFARQSDGTYTCIHDADSTTSSNNGSSSGAFISPDGKYVLVPKTNNTDYTNVYYYNEGTLTLLATLTSISPSSLDSGTYMHTHYNEVTQQLILYYKGTSSGTTYYVYQLTETSCTKIGQFIHSDSSTGYSLRDLSYDNKYAVGSAYNSDSDYGWIYYLSVSRDSNGIPTSFADASGNLGQYGYLVGTDYDIGGARFLNKNAMEGVE